MFQRPLVANLQIILNLPIHFNSSIHFPLASLVDRHFLIFISFYFHCTTCDVNRKRVLEHVDVLFPYLNTCFPTHVALHSIGFRKKKKQQRQTWKFNHSRNIACIKDANVITMETNSRFLILHYAIHLFNNIQIRSRRFFLCLIEKFQM